MIEDGIYVEPLDFDAFFQREYRAVFALAFALLRHPAAAEDVTQEAFVALYRKWKAGDRVTNPAGFVRRVVVNRCRSVFRRRMVEARALLLLGRRRPPVASIPEGSKEFWQAVRSLPGRQAQVAALFYLEDRSVSDVAAILGLQEGTVKAHLSRARRALATTLGTDEDEEAE